MAIPAWILGAIKPVADLIDNLHTSKEEQGQLELSLVSLQTAVVDQVLEYEARVLEAQQKVIVAEAQGESWIQRNWRPITMLSFVFLVVWNFGIAPFIGWAFGIEPLQLEVPDWVGTAVITGLGGYIIGRSGEKITKTIVARRITDND